MKLFFNKLMSYFPSALPTGVTEFQAWADSIVDLAGLSASRDSQHQALANMIMHLPPRKSDQRPTAYESKSWFVYALRKGAANQIASFVFQEIRKDMDAKIAELKKAEAVPALAPAASQAEATAASEDNSNGQTA